MLHQPLRSIPHENLLDSIEHLASGASLVGINQSPFAACYLRYSSDLQNHDSLDQQERACHERAQQNGHTIPADRVFSDEAVSGTKLMREGLLRMVQAAAQGMFSTLYLYSLSRLARETSIAVPLVKTLVHRYGVRVISVAEGIDSNQPGWEMALQILSLVHEQFIRDLSASVRRGHEAAQRRGLSTGDYPFGYRSVPAPGFTPASNSRQQKVPKVCVIDETLAPHVKLMFEMYNNRGYSLMKIAKELNRLGVPKDHRSSTATWHPGAVRNVLANPKYTGRWAWGRTKTKRDPMTGRTNQVVQPAEEQERWLSVRPELRIVTDEEFTLAQARLARESRTQRRRKHGRLAGGTTVANGQAPRQLLSCLIVCGSCGQPFYVTGQNGAYLGCSTQLTGDCPCKTKLQRKRSERLICEAIGKVMLKDSPWCQAVIQATLDQWRITQESLLPRRTDLHRQQQGIKQKIERLMDAVENGDETGDMAARLRQRRDDLQQVEMELHESNRLASQLCEEPSPEWIIAQLKRLHELLQQATPAAAVALRKLVNGRITVEQVAIPGKQRGYLRGRFTLDVASAVASIVGASTDVEMPTGQTEIVIDFVDDDPRIELSEKVWTLYKNGRLHIEIASDLQLNRNRVTKLLKIAAVRHGESFEDGRARQGRLKQQGEPHRKHELIAEQVMVLVNQGRLLIDIAQELGTHRDMITAAIRYWYTSRGLPVPDGRTRRKGLAQKSSRGAVS